jgi:hypothetical protein
MTLFGGEIGTMNDYQNEYNIEVEYSEAALEINRAKQAIYDAIVELKIKNDEMYRVNVSHNIFMEHEQECIYDKTNDLISNLCEALGVSKIE